MINAPIRLVEHRQVLDPISDTRSWQTLTNEEMRGIVWMFEPPDYKATYVIGCDPAQGVNGWDRTIPQDVKTDNSAIEVFRITKKEVKVKDDKGKEHTKVVNLDYQVAEYAAPVDYEQTAAVLNALGRLYRGNGRMGAAHAICEIYPGPGWMVQKTLISKFGYMNFYSPKYVNTVAPTSANSNVIGWTANRQSVRDLWIHGTRHLTNGGVVIRSPWLLREMKTTDPIKFQEYRSEAQSGFHDDLLRASMLCWWAAHDLSSQVRVETETTLERNKKAVNWQASDLGANRLEDAWNARFREILKS